jgi:hypothetical protein
MHEISLLGGGLGVAQHADSSHYLRPDRVYRTGVLSPMTGFRPGEAVMATAADFTLGPYSGMSLSGLGRPVLFPRLRNWWAGVKARARAGKGPVVMMVKQPDQAAAAVVQVHAPGASLPPTARGHAYGHRDGVNTAPMYATGMQVGPVSYGLPDSMVIASYGQSPSLPNFAADAASKTTMMRWRGLRYPWG